MMNHSFSARLLAGAAFLFLTFQAGMARAQIVMTIDGPKTTSPGGPDATFSGTITNTSSDTYVLSYGQIDSFTLDPSGSAGAVFLSNLYFPISLAPAPDPSFTYGPGDLFSASVDISAPTGLYSGIFGLYGYADSDLTQTPVELTTAPFDLTVASTPVPEASTTVSLGLLLALGMGVVVVKARRRSRAA